MTRQAPCFTLPAAHVTQVLEVPCWSRTSHRDHRLRLRQRHGRCRTCTVTSAQGSSRPLRSRSREEEFPESTRSRVWAKGRLQGLCESGRQFLYEVLYRRSHYILKCLICGAERSKRPKRSLLRTGWTTSGAASDILSYTTPTASAWNPVPAMKHPNPKARKRRPSRSKWRSPSGAGQLRVFRHHRFRSGESTVNADSRGKERSVVSHGLRERLRRLRTQWRTCSRGR